VLVSDVSESSVAIRLAKIVGGNVYSVGSFH